MVSSLNLLINLRVQRNLFIQQPMLETNTKLIRFKILANKIKLMALSHFKAKNSATEA